MNKVQTLLAKQQEQLEKVLKEENKKFNALPVAKKRVAIAKDVLLLLQSKNISPEQGTYFSFDVEDIENTNDNNAQLLLLQDGAKCECCAMGMIFLSRVRLGNKCTVKEIDNHNDSWSNRPDELIIKKNKGIFSESQLRLIEMAFEGNDAAEYFEKKVSVEELEIMEEKAEEFIGKYSNTSERIEAIMKNIIENKGTFKL